MSGRISPRFPHGQATFYEATCDIDFPYPPCPICDGDLTHDDGWWCDRCEVLWSNNGVGGEHQPDEPLPVTAEGAALAAEVAAHAAAVAAGERAPDPASAPGADT